MNLKLEVRPRGLQVEILVCNLLRSPDHTSYCLGSIVYHGNNLFTVEREGRKPLKQFDEIGLAIAEVLARRVNEFDPVRDQVRALWTNIQSNAIAQMSQPK